MRITSLGEEHLESYFVCLEDWSDEMKEAGDHKASWYQYMKDKGLGVKLALDKDRNAIGMIQYLPVEHSYADGKELYAILCIWVHGYKKKGVGNHQKKESGEDCSGRLRKMPLNREPKEWWHGDFPFQFG